VSTLLVAWLAPSAISTVAAESALVFLHLLGLSVWVGGFVAIVVVARVASRELAPPVRVAFFRALGRTYGVVATAALAVALATGVVLVSERGWQGTVLLAGGLAVGLVLATAAGVVQARSMTRLRRRALAQAESPGLAASVRRRALSAALLRATIGALTLALLAVGATLAR
jgi:uncharacterized membrane protein